MDHTFQHLFDDSVIWLQTVATVKLSIVEKGRATGLFNFLASILRGLKLIVNLLQFTWACFSFDHKYGKCRKISQMRYFEEGVFIIADIKSYSSHQTRAVQVYTNVSESFISYSNV